MDVVALAAIAVLVVKRAGNADFIFEEQIEKGMVGFDRAFFVA